MLRILGRWLLRIALALALAFAVTYVGDWAVFKIRGSPMSKVTVNQYMTVPLKGNKEEFDYVGTGDVPCSISLFGQAGSSPCWQLRRHTNQNMQM